MAARKSTSSAFEDMLKDLDEEVTEEVTAEVTEGAAPEGTPVPDEPVPVMDTPIPQGKVEILPYEPTGEPADDFSPEIPAAIREEMDAGRAALAKYAASSAKE